MDSTLKVASRVMTILAGGWDGKLVGNTYRLQWSRNSWKLEELPAKGKKKLDVYTLQSPNFSGNLSFAIPDNILHWAKVDANDSLDEVKKKILEAHKSGLEKTLKGDFGDRDKQWAEKSQDWLKKLSWYGDKVFYLNVVPEGTEPFSVKGKDFSMKVEWTKFESYSPNSDFQQADPHYSYYEAKSPTSARKLYMILKADPKALSSLSWTELGSWLNKNKVMYEVRHSNWS